MIRCLYLLCLLVGFLPGAEADAQSASPLPNSIRRVVLLGNSITYRGTFITYIDAYCRRYFPRQAIEFINLGLPSETVSGLSEAGHANGQFPRPDLHERLSRILVQTRPDLILADYGMNDGIYLPFDSVRFGQFVAGMQWLHKAVRATGTPIIHLTPPVFDEQRGGHAGYDQVLATYTRWLLGQQAAARWRVIDIHTPMPQDLVAHRASDTAYALAPDGVHPGEAGHWLMARTILAELGETYLLSVPDARTALGGDPWTQTLLDLVAERQRLLRDAWLTATGHTRPGLPVGRPLAEAQAAAAVLDTRIRTLLRRHP
ncbi:hypothetical protein GCM10027578_34960 [Spirosoma luteolum]